MVSIVSAEIEKLLGHPTPLLQDDNEPNKTAPKMNNEFLLFLMVYFLLITLQRCYVTVYF